MCQEGETFLVIIFNDYCSLFHLKKSLVVGLYELPNKVQFIQRFPQLHIIRLTIIASTHSFPNILCPVPLDGPIPWKVHRGSVLPAIIYLQQSVYWNGIQPSNSIFSMKHSLSLQIHITHFLLRILIIAFCLFNFWSLPCNTTYMTHNILFGETLGSLESQSLGGVTIYFSFLYLADLAYYARYYYTVTKVC